MGARWSSGWLRLICCPRLTSPRWWRCRGDHEAMKPAISIAKALRDPNLLGAALGDISTWRVWVAILKAAFAEPLTDDELATFKQVAGDRRPPQRRVRELWA